MQEKHPQKLAYSKKIQYFCPVKLPILDEISFCYKALLRTIEQRNDQYNARIQQIRKLEQEGKVFVIRPSEDRPVGRLEKDPKKLKALHALGMQDATEQWPLLLEYLKE